MGQLAHVLLVSNTHTHSLTLSLLTVHMGPGPHWHLCMSDKDRNPDHVSLESALTGPAGTEALWKL